MPILKSKDSLLPDRRRDSDTLRTRPGWSGGAEKLVCCWRKHCNSTLFWPATFVFALQRRTKVQRDAAAFLLRCELKRTARLPVVPFCVHCYGFGQSCNFAGKRKDNKNISTTWPKTPRFLLAQLKGRESLFLVVSQEEFSISLSLY